MNICQLKYLALIILNIVVCCATPKSSQQIYANPLVKITIASEPDYPPYCIVTKQGKADGFSIDLFLAAAKAANINVEVKIGIWNKIRQDLIDGTIDALPLVGKTPERDEVYDFTLPYLTLHGAVFVKEGKSKINSFEDLKGKKILVMKGDNAEEYVRRNKISNNIYTTNTFDEAFRKLDAGEGDAVIAQRVMGLYLLKEMDLTSIIVADISLADFRQEFCFAVKKGNTKLLSLLNEGLSIVIANETYNDIHEKWFGPSIEHVIDYKKVIEIVLYIVIPFIAILSIASVLFLRKEVKKRTKSLEKEIAEHKITVQSLQYQQLLLNEMERVTKIGGWEYDVASKKVSWTDGVYQIYGVKPSEFNPEFKDNDVQYYHPDDQKVLDDAFTRALERGEYYNLELRFYAADGTKKWVRTSGQVQYHEDKIVRVFGNIMDITEQKLAEDELIKIKDDLEILVSARTKELEDKIKKLNKSQKAMLYMVEDLNETTMELKSEREKLESANKELEAFSYSVSHDLRTPLRAIDGFSRIIVERYPNILDKEGERLFNIIRSNTQKMGYLIDDLLALSRVGRVEVKQLSLDMTSIVQSIYYELTEKGQRELITLILNDLPSAPGDTTLMRQVWTNLLSNAIKFSSKSESPSIEIGGELTEKEIVYYVRDNGVGFNPLYANKLFGVFQRLHRADQFEGTGVGLAIVQRIIHRHEGRVWAESEIGKGATFYFSLPILGV